MRRDPLDYLASEIQALRDQGTYRRLRVLDDEQKARIDAQMEQARQVAAQRSRLAGLVEGAAFLERVRAGRPTMLEVWDEVTRRLPEGTWLEKLSVEGGQLLLVGLSDDAPGLVARMEGSPLWRKPALAGELQSDAGSGRSRFTLAAQLTGAAPPPAEAADGDATSR